MTTLSRRPAWPLAAFAGLAASVYLAAALVVVPALAVAPRPEALAAALAVDLVVLVPLAYAGLLVRVRGWRAVTLGPVVALSALGAWLVLPDGHRGTVSVVLPAAEAGVVVAVVVSLLRAARRGSGGDPYERARAATARVLGDHWGSRALAYELSVVRYALGRRSGPAPGAGTFSYRRSSGYGAVLVGVAVAGVVELVGGHLLVRHFWGDGAALAHLLVSGYALVWLAGDWRALGARPTRLEDGVLHVRCGLRWSVEVPVADVEAVYHVRRPLPRARTTLDASVLRNPQLLLDLRRPVVADGPYGVRRRVTRVALHVDEPDRLLRALAAAMGGTVRQPPA